MTSLTVSNLLKLPNFFFQITCGGGPLYKLFALIYIDVFLSIIFTNFIVVSGVEMLDSCSDAETGSWRLMTKIGSMSSSGSVNQTHPPHLITASQLNTHLINLTSSLTNIRTTLVNPTSAPGAVAAVSSLVSSLHWSQTFLISSSQQLSSEMMPALSSCVLNNLTLPTDHDTKNIVTDLLTGVSNSGVNRIVVTGNGEKNQNQQMNITLVKEL